MALKIERQRWGTGNVKTENGMTDNENDKTDRGHMPSAITTGRTDGGRCGIALAAAVQRHVMRPMSRQCRGKG